MTDQPVEPEVVEAKVVDVGEVVPAEAAALDRAAEAALAMPGMPGRDEFLALAMQARVLSLSGAAPEAVRNNPHIAFHIAMVGRDLGISPSAAIELIDVIMTQKGPRLSLSPQLINGQIRRLGLGHIRPVVQEVDRCVARAYGPTGEVLGETEFSWAEAQMAGLAGVNCQPGNHKRNDQGRCPCNQGYRTYPKRMMWWRASGFAADDFFPEAGLGLYTAEELGATVDHEGRPIDPSDVPLPDGYEPAAIEAGTDDGVKADADVLTDIQIRIAALPDAQHADLLARWKQLGALAGPKKGTYARASALTEKQASLVTSVLRGLEASAKTAGWDGKAARAEIVGRIMGGVAVVAGLAQPAVEPSAGSEAPDGASGPDRPPDGESGALSDKEVVERSAPVDADGIVERVNAMTIGQVNDALLDRGREPKGSEPQRRKALAVEMLRDLLTA